jgi:tetratricopeptide (TPR) repeat protein
VAERLAHLAATSPDESLRAVSWREQFFRVIRRYAAAGPVVLVIDDLHEADPATLASLDYVINRTNQRHDLQLAIVAACLPYRQIDGESNGLNHLLETTQRLYPHGSIDLTATLDAPAARAFAVAVLDRASLPNDPATVDALIVRTGGNPRYLTSVVNSLHEHAEGEQDIASAIETTVPSEVASSLAARVSRLPLELQRILMDASVLGHDFHAETLMRMLDLSLAQFIELVDRHLWRRHGLLRADGTSVIGGRVLHTYRFQPPLLRDAIYQELSELERTHAHGRAADVLVELHGDTQHDRLERIAHHLERAGRRDEAARVYLRAGELARTRRDFDTARRLLGRGTQLETRVNDPDTRIRTLISLGLCERSAGNSAAARTHLTRALGLTSTWHDDSLEATALEALGMVDFDVGEMARGRDRILRAVDIWAAHDVPDTSRALANLSYLLYGLGHYDEAIASAEQARTEAARSRQTGSWIDGTIGLANCMIDLGRYDRAAELHEHALLVGSELGDLHRQRICWLNLALIAFERGDWGAAELAIDHVDPGDAPLTSSMESVVAFHRGLIAEGRGNGPLARTHYRHSRELRDTKGQEALAIDAVAGEMRIAMADEDHELTSTLFDDVERRLGARGGSAIDGVEHPGRLYVTLIEAAQALGRTERAGDLARAAVGFLTERSIHVPDADRERYLSGVSSHRRILSLAAHLGIVAG